MKDKTFEKVWENVIKVQAQEILKEDRILNRKGEVCFDQVIFDEKREDVKNEYDNIRGYSKFAYLKDPDGLSNRYLVSTYIILAIAKIKPFDAGKNEGTLKNEKLAIRTGMWAICLFNSYQAQTEEKQKKWKKLSEILPDTLKKLGDDFLQRLYYHLYYDISDKKYNILEMSNIIWLLEDFINIIEDGNYNATERELTLKKLSDKIFLKNEWDRSLDIRWDSIWINIVSQVAIEIVDKYKGRVVFDRTSKYAILNEYMTLINESKDNYVKLSGVCSDKYMISACFILAIAKSQPLRYNYDIHARKGIYNENLALEAGLRLLYEFGNYERSQRDANKREKSSAGSSMDCKSESGKMTEQSAKPQIVDPKGNISEKDGQTMGQDVRGDATSPKAESNNGADVQADWGEDNENQCRSEERRRYTFPEPFHNKSYKELLCLMLHYDIRENKYSVLAISNILYMIEIYTKICGNKILGDVECEQ